MSDAKHVSFFEELKRRNVFRVAFAYAVVGWLTAQVADLALDSFEAPNWVMKTILLLLALGFPLALFFSWAFELTPDGIKKEEHVDRSQSVAHRKGRKLDFAVIGLLSIALVYFVATHDWPSRDKAAAPAAGPKSIAVLPFTNMSDSQENAFFAGGVQEDILTYLAKIADLRVISRTSVRQYANDQRDLKSIAAELGVDHIVEGSVRRAGNTVRVTAQLIDARTDRHLWADSYDRNLTDVFEIQTAVAIEIATALKARLSAAEQQAISTVPTRNIAAYDLYSQARLIRRDNAYGSEQIRKMEPLLKQAVELDPQFALAHAMLGAVHTNFYWLDLDRSDTRLNVAKAAIDRAFELQPDMPEARAALAEYYYRGFKNYDRALQELKAARERFPNNPEILHMTGVTQRRLGEWDESIDSLKANTQLDPGDKLAKHLLLETMVAAQQWGAASVYADKLLHKYPGDAMIVAQRAKIFLSGFGDIAAAKRLFAAGTPVMHEDYIGGDINVTLLAKDFDGALAKVAAYEEFLTSLPGVDAFVKSWIYDQRGDEAKMREYAAQVISGLAPIVADKSISTSLPQLLVAESHARLGQFDDAKTMAEHVIGLNPLNGDAFDAPGRHEWAGRIIARSGNIDRSLDILESVANKPGGPSSWDLRLNFGWDIARENPRFIALAYPAGQPSDSR